MSAQTEQRVERVLVTPGDKLAEGDYKILTPTTAYRVGTSYYSSIVGLLELNPQEKSLKVIPLKGSYYPRVGDVVIGIVSDVGLTNWELDIRAPFPGILYAVDYLGRAINPSKENLKDFLDVGDVIVGKVEVFDRTRNPVISTKGKEFGKVVDGALVEISPVKIPRLIGKKGSMQSLIESETNCKLIIGNNGRVLVLCEDKRYEEIVVRAIRKIDVEAHISGLTDRVKEFILVEKVKKGLVGNEERKA
ncbi:MAG: exosome complex protein Rrp4 [Desulfurococcaceae archaeon]|nr:exosome complex protein Rrp4 [Desulfurococcaceae archaeon]